MGKGYIDVDDEHPEHPLFPIEEDEKAPDISYIHVTRWEKGKQVYATKLFAATELTTLEQIQELYGGGDYILIGRNASRSSPGQPGSRMTKHRKINISGAPKPMSDDPTEEELNGGKKPASPNTQPGAFGGDGGSQIFIAMMQMNQQAQERSAQAQQQFMTMFLQMMQNSKTESAAMTQMMMQMTQSQQASMLQMVTAMMANRGGGPEEMAKYAELLKTLGVGGNKESDKEKDGFSMEDLPSMIENVADIATAAAELRRGATPPSNGMPQTPQIAPGDGSAAAVAQAMNLGKQ